MKRTVLPSLLGLLLAGAISGCADTSAKPSTAIPSKDESCCVAPVDAAPGVVPVTSKVSAPDVPLVDQAGRPVRFVGDLLGRRVAAIQFVFTRCTTICPGLGLQFQGAQRLLRDQLGGDFALISISVDPTFDTSGRLESWGHRFGAEAGWTLATGEKAEVDRLLKALGNSSAIRENHQTSTLVLDGATGDALRVDGTASPATLVKAMRSLRDAPGRDEPRGEESEADQAARSYFTDARLVDQDGRSHRFFSDLLRGKTVVINTFFSECKGTCLGTGESLKKLQDRLGDRLGRDVLILSLSVDRANDTPRALAAHARKLGARPGWYFLTGDRREVDPLLKKLGQFVDVRENHSPIFLVGNLRTGLWKKILGIGPADEVIAGVESVADDAAPH
jgi:protein SCO1